MKLNFRAEDPASPSRRVDWHVQSSELNLGCQAGSGGGTILAIPVARAHDGQLHDGNQQHGTHRTRRVVPRPLQRAGLAASPPNRGAANGEIVPRIQAASALPSRTRYLTAYLLYGMCKAKAKPGGIIARIVWQGCCIFGSAVLAQAACLWRCQQFHSCRWCCCGPAQPTAGTGEVHNRA